MIETAQQLQFEGCTRTVPVWQTCPTAEEEPQAGGTPVLLIQTERYRIEIEIG